MRPWRKVQDLLRKSLGKKMDYIQGPDDADRFAGVVDNGDVIDLFVLHYPNSGRNWVTGCQGMGYVGSDVQNARLVAYLPGDDFHDDVAVGHDAARQVAVEYEDVAPAKFLDG